MKLIDLRTERQGNGLRLRRAVRDTLYAIRCTQEHYPLKQVYSVLLTA
ncbi:MAG: hypothetical protein WBQ23_09920 [Bacteroidota bacterium]